METTILRQTAVRTAGDSPEQLTDADAVERIRHGDMGGIDVLYNRHAGRLLRLAIGLCDNRADAEDVVHDVFVALPRASASFREPFQLGAWLRALVVRRALDRHRASARRREVPIELAHEHTTSPATQDFVAERRLREAIATLPVAQRAVFLLRATEGLSHSEIAAVLGIRSGTSEVRYSRAIRSLRALLGDIR